MKGSVLGRMNYLSHRFFVARRSDLLCPDFRQREIPSEISNFTQSFLNFVAPRSKFDAVFNTNERINTMRNRQGSRVSDLRRLTNFGEDERFSVIERTRLRTR